MRAQSTRTCLIMAAVAGELAPNRAESLAASWSTYQWQSIFGKRQLVMMLVFGSSLSQPIVCVIAIIAISINCVRLLSLAHRGKAFLLSRFSM